MLTFQIAFLVMAVAAVLAFGVILAWPDDGHDPLSRL